MTLIDRLSKLDGPDREVDAELEAVFVGGRVHYNDPANKEAVIERPIDGLWIRGIYPYRKIARYTASVDAAIALAERVLPGWKWRVGRTELFSNGWSYVHKYDPSNCDRTDEAACADGKAANPAIALCIALLRAKEACDA